MKQKGLLIALIVVLVLGVGTLAYYLGTQKRQSNNSRAVATVTITPAPTQSPQTTTPTPQESMVPQGWLTYTNETYGFEISYPPNYQALDDADNLYGWPNAIVLIYAGGQSYDLPIEVWDSAQQYQNKYQNTNTLTVKMIGNKYITLNNVNNEAEVDTVIATFKEIN